MTTNMTANMVLTDAICECPICFDEVAIGEKNSIITACNHTFHASCLMTNINRNGFTCPCCRSLMAEDLKNDSDEDSDYGSDDRSTEMDLDEIALDDEVYQSAYLLQGLRYFFQRVEGNQEEDEEDEEDEEEEEEDDDNSFDSFASDSEPAMDPLTLSNALRNKGVTYEQLVTALLGDHPEYDNIDTVLRTTDTVWGEIRIVLTNPGHFQEEEPFVSNIDPIAVIDDFAAIDDLISEIINIDQYYTPFNSRYEYHHPFPLSVSC